MSIRPFSSAQRGGLLITGAGGFIGRKLIDALARSGAGLSVAGLVRSVDEAERLGVPVHALDLGDAGAVQAAIAEIQPVVVAHLAAQSSVHQAASAPFEVWRSNVDATVNLARALSEHAPEAHLFFASTAECYGATFASGETLTEDAPLAPMNTYARSKVAAEYALRDLRAGGRVTTLRMFNQIGPGQDERFVSSSFAAQIARIELGVQPPTMMVGDLSAERDFCDVDDMVRALVMLIEGRDALERSSTFNICSGRTRAIREVLDILVGLSTTGIEVAVDPARLRPISIARAAGSHEALTRAIGWRPEISLEHTLERLLTHWRLALRPH